MISKELSKELQDAGFLKPNSKKRKGVSNVYMYPENWTPTLSVLIEECGEGGRSISEEDIGQWVASKSYGFKDAPEQGYGKTPEEAVARLWLKLNKKNDQNNS